MKTGYFESINGNRSSTRLIGFVIIVVALLYSGIIIYLGRNDVVAAAGAAGLLFVTVAGPAMAFLFAQKRTEKKQES